MSYYDVPPPLDCSTVQESRNYRLASTQGREARGNRFSSTKGRSVQHASPAGEAQAASAPAGPTFTPQEQALVDLVKSFDPTGWYSDSYKINTQTDKAWAAIQVAGSQLEAERAIELWDEYKTESIKRGVYKCQPF